MSRLLLVFILLLVSASAGAQMYKCTTAKGAVQYADKPCAGGSKGGEVDIRGHPPISGQLTPYKEDLRRSEADFRRREQQRDRDYDAQLKLAAVEKKKCEDQREQLGRLMATRRPANPQAHDAQIEKLKAEVAKCR